MPVKGSSINWKLVGYTVGGCWLLFASMFVLLGKQTAMFLNPLPILVKGLAGGLIYGYVGATSGWDVETIFIYWSVIGLVLAWCLHRFERNAMTVITIIAITCVVHVGISALALFPTMLLAGR
jgi:hypothetical protein